MSTFEGDQLLADVVRCRVDIGNGSLHNEIDDGSLRFVTHTTDTFLTCTRFATDGWAGMATFECLGAGFIAW